jgi:mRNA interferase RelE/StbE
MSYKLSFHPKALKEWNKLDSSIKEQFKKKLEKRLQNPKVVKDKLSGFDEVYKIKLRTAGYRLAYEVIDEKITILVLAVGQRENNKVYNLLHSRV